VHSVAAPLTTGSFTKAGDTFAGWNTAAVGSGIPHFEGRGDRTIDDRLSFVHGTGAHAALLALSRLLTNEISALMIAWREPRRHNKRRRSRDALFSLPGRRHDSC
jgi:hypothetical protein